MRLPTNIKQKEKLINKSLNGEDFTFKEIFTFKQKKMLEDGDLFIIYSNNNKWFSIVYLQDKFYAITGDPKLVEINEQELLKYKCTIYDIIENPYQEFIKEEGIDKFNSLSQADKCYVYNAQYYIRHTDEIFEGLKQALKDVVDVLS